MPVETSPESFTPEKNGAASGTDVLLFLIFDVRAKDKLGRTLHRFIRIANITVFLFCPPSPAVALNLVILWREHKKLTGVIRRPSADRQTWEAKLSIREKCQPLENRQAKSQVVAFGLDHAC